MIKIHARVTKEIEINIDQTERLINYLCGCNEYSNIEDIKEMFIDGVDAGNYENGYIPSAWLIPDLRDGLKDIKNEELYNYLKYNRCDSNDINL